MGRDESPSVAARYGLARRDRERRWTRVVDGALLLVALAWLLVLRDGAAPGGTQVAVSLVLGAMTAHRALLLVERRRRSRRNAPATAALTALAVPAAAPGVPLAADPAGPPAGPRAA